jgi:hypothetical protein
MYGYHSLSAPFWVQVLHSLLLNPQNFNKYFDILYHNLHIFMDLNIHIMTWLFQTIHLIDTRMPPCKCRQQISHKHFLPYIRMLALLSWRLWALSRKQIVECKCSFALKICSVLAIVWDHSTVYSLYNCTQWHTLLQFINSY